MILLNNHQKKFAQKNIFDEIRGIINVKFQTTMEVFICIP